MAQSAGSLIPGLSAFLMAVMVRSRVVQEVVVAGTTGTEVAYGQGDRLDVAGPTRA